MLSQNKYKEAMKSYSKGFAIGTFLGIVICLATAKFIWSLPLILGLLLGGLSFNRKLNSDGNK